ncbi:MAG: type I 3-dehydroquinate dehydratase [Planctomycetota bacterium]
MSTLLCVPIMANDVEQALEDASIAKQEGADLVEFRIDGFFLGQNTREETQACLLLSKRSPLPCIMTCRSAEEGGHYDGPDDARIALYEALGTSDHPPAYIDLEFSIWQRSANLRQKILLGVTHKDQHKPSVTTRLILSHHNFDGRPDDLLRTLAQMRQVDAAAVLKIAYTARSVRDNLELFEILRDRDRPTIALAMGEAGLMSRTLAPKFGGFLTFASLRDNSATAPGQPTIRELVDLYRFRAITRTTKLFGIIGWPVSHSKSPLIHNAGFEHAGFDGVYLPLPVAPSEEALKATLGALMDDRHLDFVGASITIPHKEHALEVARELDWDIEEKAGDIRAANTIVFDGKRYRVENTDIQGIKMPLCGTPEDLERSDALVLGAGGAALAAVDALPGVGARVLVSARDPQKLSDLVSRFKNVTPVEWGQRHNTNANLIINATPVGMSTGPAPDESPIDLDKCSSLPDDAIIFDTVYTPRETPLLKQAQQLGLRTITGVEMFIEQAASQFSHWTGHEAPRQLWHTLLDDI